MRPQLLNPLFAEATYLKGVGPKVARLLARLVRNDRSGTGDVRTIDLLWHLPTGVVDRRLRPKVAEAPEGAIVTLELFIGDHTPPPKGHPRLPYRVLAYDDSGFITLTFFHARRDYLMEKLPPGERRFVSGRFEYYDGEPQMVHPDHIVSAEDLETMSLVEPVYPLTAGLAPRTLRNAIRAALASCPTLPEWQDPAWRERQGWESFNAAIDRVHAPETAADLEPQSPARSRLAYDELLANQLALALMRRHMRRKAGRAVAGTGSLQSRIREALPFSLTGSQEQAVREILADMAQPQRMLRLLQGDVGSGKTVVALLAMAAAVEAGHQAAMMAPTELLARQHLATILPLAEQAGLRVSMLTGRERGPARRQVLDDLAAGETDIVVGTHALFQDDVVFADLALAVVDEQHRFGVHERLALQAKSAAGADLLVTTATPIPRTLALTLYGDMEVSRITEKPVGRQPIDTRVLPLERLGEVVSRLRSALDGGARCYWVCPLVSESDALDISDAEQRYAALEQVFPGRIGLVHGRMKGAEKDRVMARFQAGELAILVATTVIEVGVDVPEATIMVIEHAERFGLAQLHQLRGRVGRGAAKSSCLLLYQSPLGDLARARLDIMRQTDDGFRIAEEDLKLRGSGELLGTRQSGEPEFRVADLAIHGTLLEAARDDAALILARDERLESDRGAALRVLLYLFERDEAVRLIGAG